MKTNLLLMIKAVLTTIAIFAAGVAVFVGLALLSHHHTLLVVCIVVVAGIGICSYVKYDLSKMQNESERMISDYEKEFKKLIDCKANRENEGVPVPPAPDKEPPMRKGVL